MNDPTPSPHLGSPSVIVDDVEALHLELAQLREHVYVLDAQVLLLSEKAAALESKNLALESMVIERHEPELVDHRGQLVNVKTRVGSLEAGLAILLRDSALTAKGVEKILTWEPHFIAVSEVKRALEIGKQDPDPTPNMRGPR